MRYPIVTMSDCRSLAKQMNNGIYPDIQPSVNWLGVGICLELDRIEEVAREVDQVWKQYHERDKDRLEGRVAPILYSALQEVCVEILDDPGFWRYLSLAYFWDFIKWRENTAFEEGNYLKYVDGQKSTECVLTRMYLRVQALGGSEYGSMAAEVKMSTDLWRSHIIRVRTGTAPPLTRAFVKWQRDNRLKTPDLREFAKRLNRTWTNVLLNIYDDEEAERLIAELWPS